MVYRIEYLAYEKWGDGRSLALVQVVVFQKLKRFATWASEKEWKSRRRKIGSRLEARERLYPPGVEKT
jgi:hypothetical protein